MEMPADHVEETQQQQAKKKGGLKTIPFIMSNEIFENVANTGLHANMIIYLTERYHMSAATGTSVLLMWRAVSNFLPIFGAFLSDSYLGRFKVIAIGSIVSLLGMVLLWLTAVLSGEERPPHYKWRLLLLFSAFALMSIGSGGIRPCSLAFGADQLVDQKRNSPQNQKTLQTFFNWYYTSVGLSVMIAVTVIVYVQEAKGWVVGFGIPIVLMIFSIILFLIGSPLYIKIKGDKSVLVGLAQVIVVSLRNWRIAVPSGTAVQCLYLTKNGSKLKAPSEELRFLNKACIIQNPEKDINPEDGGATNPWKLCTVDQVETLKSAVRILPIWSAGFIPAVAVGQSSTFSVLQAAAMDRRLGPRLTVPAASFGAFGVAALALTVALYDRALAPRISKRTGNPRGLALRHRIAVGLALMCAAAAAAARVEAARRYAAAERGERISALWLAPQHCLMGAAEAFCLIGQIEFYYAEFPKSMESVGVSLFSLGLCVGNLLGSLLVQLIKRFSRSHGGGGGGGGGSGGGVSWVDTNPNKGHYDYYYWVIALLCVLNLGYFLVCSWAYGEEGKSRVWEGEGEGEGNEEI